MVSSTKHKIDDSLLGGNASSDRAKVITGVDIVMSHHVQEASFTKKA